MIIDGITDNTGLGLKDGLIEPADLRARISGKNVIINGDMRVDQRNGGALVTGSGYDLDRWRTSYYWCI